MKKINLFLSGAMLSILFYGCATIINGSSQDVALSSNPSNAKVTINNEVKGNTPLTASLSRKDEHTVKIELDGFHPYETKIMKETSGWVWGNILIGGLIGLVVDLASGGIYNLTPEQVNAEMRQMGNQTSYLDESGKIFFTVVLTPKPEWNKIGQLQKTNN